ncbi:aminotransferase class V-fold PLP-dependent enzyme [Sinimarinibacterium sp. CAU 1509]|uniref:aminotransferase class V-fold PLP-dependent enzyme n=1 Tax=Sinimarinibacterium sp. CAU 1509 TaxID=2562283 RepID=UPI0010AD8227|nr:aminotransferase class V-fold PLP-dependent enzyme [Sinimarinibacterium sp. CAU 1509]TJY60820.1 aminotransferase class V-fold PLP-dependent enzyme [Sinimarinibacterium sp. CAU 1509]
MLSRRQLLGWSAAGAAAAAARSFSSGSAMSVRNASWSEVRAGFAFASTSNAPIPMNAANLCPALSMVTDRVHAAAQRLDLDASFHHRLLYQQTERAALGPMLERHLGIAHKEDVALVRNTSEANSIVVNGLPLTRDDEVLLWSQNHHTNNRSWAYRAQRDGFAIRVVDLPTDPVDDTALIAPFLSVLTPKTRVVSFSHISNTSGLRLPAAALCAAIREVRPDIYIHVDGAQSWGAAALNLAAMDCDSYAASAHKWLAGPRELGILYVRPAWAARMHANTIGYDYRFDYPEADLPQTAARFECLGQRNDAALSGLNAALQFHLDLGPERIEARISELGRQLREKLRQIGLTVLTPSNERYALGVTVVDVGPSDAMSAFRSLYETRQISAAFIHEHRIVGDIERIAADQPLPLYLRLCPHICNDEADIERATTAVAQIAGRA